MEYIKSLKTELQKKKQTKKEKEMVEKPKKVKKEVAPKVPKELCCMSVKIATKKMALDKIEKGETLYFYENGFYGHCKRPHYESSNYCWKHWSMDQNGLSEDHAPMYTMDYLEQNGKIAKVEDEEIWKRKNAKVVVEKEKKGKEKKSSTNASSSTDSKKLRKKVDPLERERTQLKNDLLNIFQSYYATYTKTEPMKTKKNPFTSTKKKQEIVEKEKEKEKEVVDEKEVVVEEEEELVVEDLIDDENIQSIMNDLVSMKLEEKEQNMDEEDEEDEDEEDEEEEEEEEEDDEDKQNGLNVEEIQTITGKTLWLDPSTMNVYEDDESDENGILRGKLVERKPRQKKYDVEYKSKFYLIC
jgi:hypothetical protein